MKKLDKTYINIKLKIIVIVQFVNYWLFCTLPI